MGSDPVVVLRKVALEAEGRWFNFVATWVSVVFSA